MKKFKVKIFAVVSVIMIMAFAGSASAASLKTSEFGTFSYSLTKSGNSVTASTSITKTTPSTNVITKLEIQNNATGAVIYKREAYNIGGTLTAIKATKLTAKKLAAFSTHEARGKTSVAKYLAQTF